MTDLPLDLARALVDGALAHAGAQGLKPLAVAVLDARGALRAFAAQDGCSLKRGELAHAKAYGALALGMGSRALFERAQAQPFFVSAAAGAVGGALLPVPGGVLVRDGAGALLGAMGVSGDTSDHDEAAACAAIAGCGLIADTG